jgi:hypothetical protein
VCRGPYPKYTSCAGISLTASILRAACVLNKALFSNSNLSWMDIGPRRIRQGDGSEQCLPKKIKGHLLLEREGTREGGWERKISSEASFDRLWRKVAAIKTSPMNRINIMARDGAEACGGRGGALNFSTLVCHQTRASESEQASG